MKQVEERYINLLTDFGFKRILGTAMNKDLPKNSPKRWALYAHGVGNQCPTHGLSMPSTWSLSAHVTGIKRPGTSNHENR